MTSKTYVLDTNVFIHDDKVLEKFENATVVIPFTVLEELDNLKRKNNITGYIARQVSKNIETLVNGFNLKTGVALPNNVTVKLVSYSDFDVKDKVLDITNPDNRIILVAYYLWKQNINQDVIFVSKDVNARLKARGLGLKAIDYVLDNIGGDNIYTGQQTIIVDSDTIKHVYVDGFVEIDFKLYNINPIENEFFILKSQSDSSSALTIYKKGKLFLIKDTIHCYDIKPKNKEQKFALQLLLDSTIPIVSLQGVSGTGKTFLSIASALSQTIEKNNKYKKILILKPIVPVGRDIGWLKGDKLDKLEPWVKSYFDNLELLIDDYEYLIENGIIEIEAITYLRGRSLNDMFILVDEVQNISPQILKTIMTRVGFNSKIVLLGDIQQIDNPYLNAQSNALTYLITKLKGSELFGHVTLTETIRSVVSELAVEKL